MKKRNLLGQRFERLEVIDSLPPKKGSTIWMCVCDCGALTDTYATALVCGLTRSCGCLRREVTSLRRKSHGKAGSKVYRAWCDIWQRTTNPKRDNHYLYGARCLKVCARWKSFDLFFEDMGEPPSTEHSLDRIDNYKGYSPNNCRWADRLEQARNRRDNVILRFRGEDLKVHELTRVSGVSGRNIRQRISTYGWSVERAVTEPIQSPKEKLMTTAKKGGSCKGKGGGGKEGCVQP